MSVGVPFPSTAYEPELLLTEGRSHSWCTSAWKEPYLFLQLAFHSEMYNGLARIPVALNSKVKGTRLRTKFLYAY
jgi:hypothetical protein